MELNDILIEELNDEIIHQIVIDDLKYYTNQDMKDTFIKNILGEVNDDSNIVDKLVSAYKKSSPYMGYYNKYLDYKKKILKQKYNIEIDIVNDNDKFYID